jgi:hypothetical protein
MDDVEACKARWTGVAAQLETEFGKPDSAETGGLMTQVIFKFTDGAVVKATRTGWLMTLSFRSSLAATSK